MNRNPEARQEAKNHLNRFLPRELIAKYKNIVVVDFIKTAGSVRQGLNLIQEHIGSDGPTAKVAVLEIDQVSLDIEEGTFREHPVQRIKVKGELAQSIAYQRPEDYAEFPKYTIGTGSERSLNRQTQYADLMLRTGHYLSSEGIRSVPQEQLVSQWLETHVRSFEQFENAISTVKSSQIQGKKLTATIERNPYTDTEKVSIFIRNSDGTDTRITINDKLIEAQIRSGNQRALTYESAIKHLETELTLKKTILTQVLKDPAIIGTTIWEELIFKLAAYPKGAQFVHETLVLDRALKTNPFVKIIAPLVTPERPSFLSCLLKKYATR